MKWRVSERGGRWFPLVRMSEGSKWMVQTEHRDGYPSRETALEIVREQMKRVGGSLEEEWTPSNEIIQRWLFLRWLSKRGEFDQDKVATSTTIREILAAR